MSQAVQLNFNETERCLWPSLIILRADRPQVRAESILAEVAGRLRAFRALADDDCPPERLRSPTSSEDVINWLHNVWLELTRAGGCSQQERRRALFRRLLDSRLSPKDQSRLVTALDYLARLAEARHVARSVGGGVRTGAPSIRNSAMQSAYRKLAGLACTSLPIWLAGEKGTELDWMAHLAHTLGGAPEGGFHISDLDEKEEDLLSMGGMDLPGPGGREATLVARCADRAPRHVQQKLHDLLAGRLAAGSEPRVIVTSEPIDVTNGDESGVYVDLFAFLYPSMIHVPPLRSRTEDIAPLMSFLAFKRNAEDPVPRINAAAILALQSYHWPRNVEELESVTRFILERKPAGEIGLGDLPESIHNPRAVPQPILDALRRIYREEGFRVLSTEEKRSGIARFLTEPQGTSFGALDFMKAFNQGRETARRILATFVSSGLVKPVKGPSQQRTTKYSRVVLTTPPTDG